MSEGFAIDVTTQFETLLACGMVPVKVSGMQGPLLVFLALITVADKKEGLTSILQSQSSKYIQKGPWSWAEDTGEEVITGESKLLCCQDIPEVKDERCAHLKREVVVEWSKIIGFYNSKGRKFA